MTHKTIIDYLSILSCVCATGKQKQKGIGPFEERSFLVGTKFKNRTKFPSYSSSKFICNSVQFCCVCVRNSVENQLNETYALLICCMPFNKNDLYLGIF